MHKGNAGEDQAAGCQTNDGCSLGFRYSQADTVFSYLLHLRDICELADRAATPIAIFRANALTS